MEISIKITNAQVLGLGCTGVQMYLFATLFAVVKSWQPHISGQNSLQKLERVRYMCAYTGIWETVCVSADTCPFFGFLCFLFVSEEQKKTVVIFSLWKRDLGAYNFWIILYVYCFSFSKSIWREAGRILIVFPKEHRSLALRGTLEILGQLLSI